MTAQRKKLLSGIGLVIAAIGAALALSLAASGCTDNATADTPLGISSASVTGAAVGPMAPPTLSELKTALNLDEEQAAAVGTALARWQDQVQTRSTERHRMRDRNDYAGPVNGPPEGMMGHEPPVMGFVAACSPVLDTAQFSSLCGMLAQRMDQQRDRMQQMRQDRLQDRVHDRQLRRDRTGRGSGSGPGMLQDLNLTPEERKAVREAMRTAEGSVHDLLESHAAGNATAEAVRDGALQAQNQLRTSLQSALGAEQFEGFSKALAAGAGRMAAHRLQRMENGDRSDRRIDFLTRVLQLDDAQAAAVKSVFDEAQYDERSLLEGIRDGGTTYADALYQGIQLHDRIHDQIRDRLRVDQQDRLDALKQLRRGPRPLRIYL